MASSTDLITVLGGTSAGAAMAHALRRAGLPCALVDPDPDDHDRLRHFLTQLTTSEDAATQARIRITAFTLTTTPAPTALTLDFSQGAQPSPDDTATHADLITGQGPCFRLPAPAHLAHMVELGPMDPTTLERLQTLAETLGWHIVQTRKPGLFPSARLMARLIAEADNLLIHGAIPHEIDEAMTAFGFAIGPYEALDLQGLDHAYAMRRARPQTAARSAIQDRMVQEGRLGKKSGVGFYRYPGGGGAVIDPLIEDLIREEAHFARIPRQPIPLADIAPRLIATLMDEAATMLAEGDVADAGTLDLLSRLALGFPKSETGLATYANCSGLAQALDVLTNPSGPPPLRIGTALTDRATRGEHF